MREDWGETKTSNVAKLIRGITYKKDDSLLSPKDGYLPILRANNITHTLSFDNLVYVKEQLVKEHQFINKDDIVFSMSSGSKHLVGKSAIANEDFNGSYGAFCSLLRVSDSICKRFISYYFHSSSFRKIISEASKGSNINNLKRSHIEDAILPLPPLPEQRAIVSKIEQLFSELDNGIKNLKKSQEQLKVYRQAVLKKAYEGELTKEWRDKQTDLPTADELLEQIKVERENYYHKQLEEWKVKVKEWEDSGKKSNKPLKPSKFKEIEEFTSDELSNLPSVPSFWKWIKSEEFNHFITKGTTPKKHEFSKFSTSIPFIKVYNLRFDGLLDFSIEPTFVNHSTHISFLKRSIVLPDDILMNIVGPPLGKISIVPKTYQQWNINQAIARFRTFDSVKTKYFAFYLMLSDTQHRFSKKATATAGQFNLTLEICRNIETPICSIQEQNQIVQEIESRLSVCDKVEAIIEENLVKSEALRQSILKKAFEGTLLNDEELAACRMEPDWEPASVLLERIKAEKKK